MLEVCAYSCLVGFHTHILYQEIWVAIASKASVQLMGSANLCLITKEIRLNWAISPPGSDLATYSRTVTRADQLYLLPFVVQCDASKSNSEPSSNPQILLLGEPRLLLLQ